MSGRRRGAERTRGKGAFGRVSADGLITLRVRPAVFGVPGLSLKGILNGHWQRVDLFLPQRACKDHRAAQAFTQGPREVFVRLR